MFNLYSTLDLDIFESFTIQSEVCICLTLSWSDPSGNTDQGV